MKKPPITQHPKASNKSPSKTTTLPPIDKPKHPGGRPPKYSSPEQLQSKIDEYFGSCWTDKITETTAPDGTVTMSTVRYQHRPYTIMGLALALDLTRQGLCEYAAKKGLYSDIVKKAKNIVEMNVEEMALWNKNAAGPIFWLKNHGGYVDRQNHDLNVRITLEDIVAGGK